MKAQNALALLSLIRHNTLDYILAAGALEGVTELVAYSKGEADGNQPDEGVYLVMPYSEQHGLRKVDAIKTIRVMFGMGLKEAKDLFDAMMVDATTQFDGSVRIGPFVTDTKYSVLVRRLAEASHKDNLLTPILL